MLRLGEELQALVKAAEQPVVIDIEQGERMLDVLGVPRDEPLIFARWWNDGDGLNMRHYPRKNAGEGYDWATLQVDRFYEAVAADFRPGTDSFGFVPERGGVAYGKRKEITEVRFLKYEIDDAGMSLEAQFETWRSAGLPPPTLVLFTGGKSLHFWWRLKTPLPLAEGIVALKRLQQAIRQATPGVKLDPKMESPAQPMRLAGGIHPRTGQRSTIYAADGRWYEASEILRVCPAIEVKAKAANDDGGLFRAEEGEPATPGEYPEPDELTQPVPLRLGLSSKTYEVIHRGHKEGLRAKSAFDIARSIQEARAMIEFLGYRVEEDPLNLFKVYCRNSDWCGYQRGFDECVERHFAGPDDVGTGELSKSALRRVIAKWAEDTGQWRYRPNWGRGKGFGNKKDESSRVVHLADRSLPHRLDFFQRYVRRTVREHRNSFRRAVYLKDVLKKVNLRSLIKDDQLVAMTMVAHDEIQGNVFNPLNAAQRKAMEMPTIEWLIPDAVPKGDLTIVGGPPKVGKTNFAVDMARAIARGESWLTFASAKPGYVILITDDQADGDSAKQMERLKLWDEPNLSWSRKIRLNERQLDLLLDEIKQHPGCVVVLDSLRSATRSLGCDENSPELGLLLYDVKAAVIDAGGSLILVHHGHKGQGSTGGEALSGHNSIAGSANTIWTLHHVANKDGWIDKDKPERRAVREARSGKAWDLVITMRKEGGFGNLGAYGDFLAKIAAADEEKATEKALRKAPQVVKEAILKLVEVRQNGDNGLGILDVMKAIEACGADVDTASSLNKTQKNQYKQIERWFKDLRRKGLTESLEEPGGFGGKARSIGWTLTDRGIELAEHELGG